MPGGAPRARPIYVSRNFFEVLQGASPVRERYNLTSSHHKSSYQRSFLVVVRVNITTNLMIKIDCCLNNSYNHQSLLSKVSLGMGRGVKAKSFKYSWMFI